MCMYFIVANLAYFIFCEKRRLYDEIILKQENFFYYLNILHDASIIGIWLQFIIFSNFASNSQMHVYMK